MRNNFKKNHDKKNIRLNLLFNLIKDKSIILSQKAIKQIGEYQKLYPKTLQKLLTKSATYLFSTNWDTRILANLIIDEIVRNVPIWLPKMNYNIKEEKKTNDNPFLQFEDFHIIRTMKKGKPLLSGEVC